MRPTDAASLRRAIGPGPFDHLVSDPSTELQAVYGFVAPVAILPRAPSMPVMPATHNATSVATGRSKILIVDDEPLNVDYLEQELAALGYDTISAANGQEALEKVAAEAPDPILLDVMMPVLDGFTVCRILKDHFAKFVRLVTMPESPAL